MTPQMLKFMQWGLPGISLIFTSFLPSAVQLSFFVSGLASAFQATLFRNPRFRTLFKMIPLPSNSIPGTKPPAPYKGTMNVRTPSPLHSQAKATNSSTQATAIENSKISSADKTVQSKGLLGSTLKDIMGTYQSAKRSVKTVTGKGKESIEQRRIASERKEAAKFEEKRREELKRERWEREHERFEARARAKQEARK